MNCRKQGSIIIGALLLFTLFTTLATTLFIASEWGMQTLKIARYQYESFFIAYAVSKYLLHHIPPYFSEFIKAHECVLECNGFTRQDGSNIPVTVTIRSEKNALGITIKVGNPLTEFSVSTGIGKKVIHGKEYFHMYAWS